MKTGNLSQAASMQDIPVSTASRHLSELREFFNDPLFTRYSHGLLPTQKARELILRVSSLLEGFSTLKEELSFDPSSVSREIRIGCVDNALLAIFPHLIEELSQKAPNICLCIHPLSSNRFELLRQNELDLIISPLSSIPSENFHVLNLSPQRYVIVCRDGHPLYRQYCETGRPISTEEIIKYRFTDILLSHNRYGNSLLRNTVFPDLAIAKSAVKSYYFLSSAGATLHSDFLMVLPEKTALFFAHAEGAAILPTETQSVVHTPKLIWYQTTNADPTLQWIRALIYSSNTKNSTLSFDKK